MPQCNEKDKVFALQYIASEERSKISYRATLDENQRAKAAIKRKHPKSIRDKNASYGPPDKCQHFDGNSLQVARKRK